MYFDDLLIVHDRNNAALQVTQSSDYLPFGLSFNEYYQSRTGSITNSGYSQNKYQFQGQEKQIGFDLGWYHFKYRMHDPAIGRFGMVDPLADKYTYNSTYAFSENRLIDGVELEGAEWEGFAAGFGAAYGPYVSRNSDNWDDGWFSGGWDMFTDYAYDKTLGNYDKIINGVSNKARNDLDYKSGSGTYSDEAPMPQGSQDMNYLVKDVGAKVEIAKGYLGLMKLQNDLFGVALGGLEGSVASGFSSMLKVKTPYNSFKGKTFVFGTDKATLSNAENVFQSSWDNVIVHGTHDAFIVNGVRNTPEQLAKLMYSQGYKSGTPVNLISCYTGLYEEGAAFQLSQYLNATVRAPSNRIAVVEGTHYFESGYWSYSNLSKLIK